MTFFDMFLFSSVSEQRRGFSGSGRVQRKMNLLNCSANITSVRFVIYRMKQLNNVHVFHKRIISVQTAVSFIDTIGEYELCVLVLILKHQ